MSPTAAAAADGRYATACDSPLLSDVSLSRRNDSVFHWVILLLCGGILFAAFCLQLGEPGVVLTLLNHPLPELCMLRRLTGMSCPGCGLTRCFISLAHGNLASAWSFNPAGTWLFAIVAAQLPLRAYQLWRIRLGRGELVLVGLGQAALAIFVVGLLGQWLLRLAGMPF